MKQAVESIPEITDAEFIQGLYEPSFLIKDFDINKAFGFWHFKNIPHCFVGTLEDCIIQKDEYLKIIKEQPV